MMDATPPRLDDVGASITLHRAAASTGFDLSIGDTLVMRHRTDAPALFVGSGRADVDMYRGNYFLSDRLDARIPLTHATIDGDTVTLSAAADTAPRLRITIDAAGIRFAALDPALNRSGTTGD